MCLFAQESKKVAILEPVDHEGKMTNSHKLMLRSNLVKAVTNTPGFEAYDRSDIDAIMNEQNFQRTGLVSDDQIKRLGQMTGVAYVLVCEGALVDASTLFVAAKLLNVETAKVEMTDNVMMGVTPDKLKEGCETLANTLFGREDSKSKKNVTQNSSVENQQTSATKNVATQQGGTTNTTASQPAPKSGQISQIDKKHYEYRGITMDRRGYEKFLRNNCNAAYKQFHVGKQLKTGGWLCLGTGLTFLVIGAPLMGLSAEDGIPELYDAGAAFVSLGVIGTVGSIPLLTIGSFKEKKSVSIYNNSQCKAYNSNCKSLTFNLVAGNHGLGIAMNF